MTNEEWLKSKINLYSTLELAKFLYCCTDCNHYCTNKEMYVKGCKCGKDNCIKYIIDWLKQEHKE